MPKDPKPVLQVDPQDSNQNIITSLNKIIKQKDEEINRIRQENEDLRKGKNQSPESNAMMKEIRKLKGVEQKYTQLQQDYDKLWSESSKKDKDVIELRGKVKVLEENQEEIHKLKLDKKNIADKNKKLEKEKENVEAKNEQLAK